MTWTETPLKKFHHFTVPGPYRIPDYRCHLHSFLLHCLRMDYLTIKDFECLQDFWWWISCQNVNWHSFHLKVLLETEISPGSSAASWKLKGLACVKRFFNSPQCCAGTWRGTWVFFEDANLPQIPRCPFSSFSMHSSLQPYGSWRTNLDWWRRSICRWCRPCFAQCNHERPKWCSEHHCVLIWFSHRRSYS